MSSRILRRAVLCVLMIGLLMSCQQQELRPLLEAVQEPGDLAQREERQRERYRELRTRFDEELAIWSRDGDRDGALAASLLSLGIWHQAHRDYELAKTCYLAGERLEPDAFRWPYLRALVQETVGEFGDAREAFERVLALQPAYVPALVRLAELETGANDLEAAKALLRRASEVVPNDTRVLYGSAKVAMEEGDFGQARELLIAALEREPTATRILYALAETERALGATEAAMELFERARIDGNADRVRIEMDDPLMQRVLVESQQTSTRTLRQAERLEKSGNPAAAGKLLRELLEEGPETANLRFLLGLTKRQEGDLLGAIEEQERAIALDDTLSAAHYQLGLLRRDTGGVELAESSLRRALVLDPQHRHARLVLGDLLRNTNRCQEAVAVYAEDLAVDVLRTRARMGLAMCHVELGAWQEARENAEEGIRLVPGDGRLRHLLARVLAVAPESSQRDGPRALDLMNTQRASGYGIQEVETVAMAHAASGDFAAAAAWQERALRALPEGHQRPWVQERLRGYRSERLPTTIFAAGERRRLLPVGGR